ncbi:MAG: 4-(cytidine 5'-diphospho)-2-C-methyl-D-erythritol kinase [Lachnospiraceae bacterium]|nr:4-(cytidine 5'-diphospho)-2-C-methyl-D-erythritol kinase [Lachnospiraceae bacterium]
MQKKAYAKINPVLDVLRRREDGYHELRMIMQTVNIYDTLELVKSESGIRLTCDTGLLPCDDGNIVYRAARLMQETFSLKEGIEIHLTKKIPMAAGMAGGSADAAATLHGMNELFDLKLTTEKLCELGVKLGADVPYCIMGGTMLAEGIGEKLTALPPMPECRLVVAKPDFDVSTKYVYENLHANSLKEHPDVDGMIAAIRANDLEAVATCMENVLETVTVRKYPQISELKNLMCNMGALNALMSGSGPSVFGLFTDEKAAEDCATEIRKNGLASQVFVTNFCKPE